MGTGSTEGIIPNNGSWGYSTQTPETFNQSTLAPATIPGFTNTADDLTADSAAYAPAQLVEVAGVYPARPVASGGSYIYVGVDWPSDITTSDLWIPTSAVAGILPNAISGLIQWNKADAIPGASDGDSLSTWLASAGNNLTNALGAGTKPVYKTGIRNGRPAVRFTAASQQEITVPAMSVLTTWTFFMVWKSTLTTTQNAFSQDTSGFSDDVQFGVNPESGTTTASKVAWDQQNSSDSSRSIVTSTTTLPPSTPQIHVVRYTGATLQLFENSLATVMSSASKAGCQIASRSGRLGRNPNNSSTYLDGDIFEWGMYSASIADSDLAGLVRSLGSKYAITVS